MILNVSDNLLSTPFVLGPLLSFFHCWINMYYFHFAHEEAEA